MNIQNAVSFVLILVIIFIGLGIFYTWLYWVLVPFFLIMAAMIQLRTAPCLKPNEKSEIHKTL